MKIYKISDILDSIEPVQHYIGIFEETPDPDIEWPHRHNFYSIVWFTQGKGLNVIDFEEYEILPSANFTIILDKFITGNILLRHKVISS